RGASSPTTCARPTSAKAGTRRCRSTMCAMCAMCARGGGREAARRRDAEDARRGARGGPARGRARREAVARERTRAAASPHRGAGLTVSTPQLSVTVLGDCRVAVAGGRSLVEVREGRVRIAAPGGRALEVGAGQQIDSDDARLRPAAALEPPPVAPLAVARA